MAEPMRVPALVGLLLAATAAAADPGLRAEQIRDGTARELQIGGPDAVGGVGDWYLANDVVEAIVDDPGRAFGTLGHGGTLVDVGLRDRRDEDQFARLFPLLNLDQRVLPAYDGIRAEVDEAGGFARLVVSGRRLDALPRQTGLARILGDWLVPPPEVLRPVSIETEYAVFPGEPFIHITTVLRNEGDQPVPLFAYGDVWMRGGRSARSFVGNALAPERTRGFHHTDFDRKNLFAGAEPLASFTHVSVIGMRQFPPIAYALFSPERAARGRVQYGVTGKHVNFVNVFVGDPDWPSLGLLRLARATWGELPAGSSFTYTRRLLVTGRADAASTTDVIFRELGVTDGSSGLEGQVEPRDEPCVIQVDRDDGVPVTEIETSQDGRYRALLPPGRYVLHFRAAQRPPLRAEVTVNASEFAQVPPQRFPQPGWLRFAPAFADGGPGRIVVQGVAGTKDPRFQPELLDFRLDGETVQSGSESNQLFFLGGGRDPQRVAVPPGRYALTATRGFEWDARRVELEVGGPGEEVRVAPFALRRVIRLDGIASADLHVHAQASDDSGMANTMRLASFVAEGVDLMVSTDHNRIGDFRPALAELGLVGRIRVVQGVEATNSGPSRVAPFTTGHHNAWPIPFRPEAHRSGAPPVQNLPLADLYARLRAEYGARVVQLNHARDGSPGTLDEGAYFTHLGNGEPYRPDRPLEAEPNRRLLETAADGHTRPIDFDVMEVLNGRSFAQHRLLRQDWYSLLRQGVRRTATANSDTHAPGELAGYPRNYVYVGDPEWSDAALDAALKEGRSFGSNGPLVAAFRVEGGGAQGGRLGDQVPAPGGRVTVEIQVAAAPWVPVDEVRLVVNGETWRRWRDLPPHDAGHVLRLRERAELSLAADAFLTLEAGAPLDAEPADWAASHPGLYTGALAPGHVPVAFANPIFVDVDGNGRFDAPGLPAEPMTSRALSWLAAPGLLLLLWLAARLRAGRV
jgi:hypothetical protein